MRLISMKNGSLACEIAPEMGGAIFSYDYRAGGKIQHLMRPTADQDEHRITYFSCWPLVPFSNRINKGKFSFGGKDYRVPIVWIGPPHHASHGHGWERPWDVISHSATHCHLEFSFNDKVVWPFPYKAEQEFELTENGLRVRLSVTNTGTEPMPAGLGLHPYFPRPKGTTLQATVAHLWEIDQDTIPTVPVDVPAEYQFETPKNLDNARLDHCFDGFEGTAELTWPDQPMKLRISSSENLRHLVVYTPQNEEFCCVEPVSHMPNAINRTDVADNGLVVLKPGEKLVADYFFEAVTACASHARPSTEATVKQEMKPA